MSVSILEILPAVELDFLTVPSLSAALALMVMFEDALKGGAPFKGAVMLTVRPRVAVLTRSNNQLRFICCLLP